MPGQSNEAGQFGEKLIRREREWAGRLLTSRARSEAERSQGRVATRVWHCAKWDQAQSLRCRERALQRAAVVTVL